MTRNRQPAEHRIASVRDAFTPRGAKCANEVPNRNSFKLILHSPNILGIDRQRTKGETASTPDNRARLQSKNSGAAETGNQHSVGHIRCPACESARSRSVRSVIDPKLDFSTAAKNWLAWHRTHISARTAGDYAQYIATLELFGIGPAPLTEIHPGHFIEYQEWRRTKPKRGAKNPRINQELNCLKQIVEQAGLWDAIKPFYKQLPMPKWKPPRVYTPEQEDEVLRTLASNPNWQVAQCAITITDNSAIGPGELRAMLVEHIHLERNVVDVAAGELGDKNEFRIAPMALNRPAHAAFEVLLERYYFICAKQGIEASGKHFLIPLREKRGTYDPRQQASPSFIRSALREVSAIVGYRVRHNSFRHQCLTSLLEIPEISEETVKAIARHKISERTIEHYSHIRIHKKQNALDMLHDRRRFEALRRPPQRVTREEVFHRNLES